MTAVLACISQGHGSQLCGLVGPQGQSLLDQSICDAIFHHKARVLPPRAIIRRPWAPDPLHGFCQDYIQMLRQLVKLGVGFNGVGEMIIDTPEGESAEFAWHLKVLAAVLAGLSSYIVPGSDYFLAVALTSLTRWDASELSPLCKHSHIRLAMPAVMEHSRKQIQGVLEHCRDKSWFASHLHWKKGIHEKRWSLFAKEFAPDLRLSRFFRRTIAASQFNGTFLPDCAVVLIDEFVFGPCEPLDLSLDSLWAPVSGHPAWPGPGPKLEEVDEANAVDGRDH